MTEPTWTVYGLFDYDADEPFYIGITQKHLNSRLGEHQDEVRTSKGNLSNKLKKMIDVGLANITIRAIDTNLPTKEAAESREYRVIREYKRRNVELTNKTHGQAYVSNPNSLEEIDATDDDELDIIITQEDIDNAVCEDPGKCVIAMAMRRLGNVRDIQVGNSITKVTYPRNVLRYKPQAKLLKALKEFDLTGKWNLPPGTYTLKAPKGTQKLKSRPSRWKKVSANKTKPGQDSFGNGDVTRITLPTRKISRARLCCLAVNL